MPSYNQYTLSTLTTEISSLLDDTAQRYWTTTEIKYGIQEAMYVWGALTSYWRNSQTFKTSPNLSYYDLSTYLPTLRTRNWTLGQLMADIQYAILEAPNGITGTGMSGQTTPTAILNAITRARNRFVLDSVLPFTVNTTNVNIPSPDGIVQFTSVTEYVHRVSWMDTASGTWTNLWRQDNYAADAGLYQWSGTSGAPRVFSESNITPLDLQLIPPPAAAGVLETISILSQSLDLTNPNTTFNIPDEWIHAIKWGTLADLLGADSQIADPLRAQYAETRYKQAVDFAKNSKSVMRLVYNNTPLMIDTLANIDAGYPTWRNTPGPPQHAGILYDLVAVVPGAPQAAYTIQADVVQSAPIPIGTGDPIDIGLEDIGHLMDYVVHILNFKCGGKEFEASYYGYNDFMDAVAMRGRINKARIQYLKPTLEQPAMEQAERPDVYNLQSAKKGGSDGPTG